MCIRTSAPHRCVRVSVSVYVPVYIRTSASHRGGGRPAVCKAAGHRDFTREEGTMGRLQRLSILQIFLCLGGEGDRYYYFYFIFIFILAAFDPSDFPVLGRGGGQVLTGDVESVCVCACVRKRERERERKCE